MSKAINLRPFVGIGVYIFNKSEKVLLGKRKGSYGGGEFSPPGGHLEFGETFEQTAKREVLEETGLKIKKIKLFFVDNNLGHLKSGKHYVTLSFRADFESGKVQNLEPHKCEGWNWYALKHLPKPLSEFARNALKELKAHPL